jgi:calcineurin-like phosphoesterase family protein
MLANWQRLVQADEPVLHLGDLVLANGKRLRRRVLAQAAIAP